MRPKVPDLTTERSFDSQATPGHWSAWLFIHGCLYNPALVDARLTGAGIKSLYCIYITILKLQYRHLIPAPVDRTSAMPGCTNTK